MTIQRTIPKTPTTWYKPVARAMVIHDDGREPDELIGHRDLREIQKLLGCDCLDHSTQYVKGHKFNILVDDSGLIDGRKPTVSTVDRFIGLDSPRFILYGSLWIEPWGDERHQLTDEEVEAIQSRIIWAMHRDTKARHTVLITDGSVDCSDIDLEVYDTKARHRVLISDAPAEWSETQEGS